MVTYRGIEFPERPYPSNGIRGEKRHVSAACADSDGLYAIAVQGSNPMPTIYGTRDYKRRCDYATDISGPNAFYP